MMRILRVYCRYQMECVPEPRDLSISSMILLSTFASENLGIVEGD